MAHVVPLSWVLAFITKMSQKHKSTSPTAIRMKNQRKTIGIEEKWDVTRRLQKCEGIVDISCNVRFAHTSIHTIQDNAVWITENVRSGTKVFV